MTDTHIVYLGLGTNLGDKEANLKCAIAEIEKQIGEVVSLSAFHVSKPWGFNSQNSFLNAVCSIRTKLDPFEVLHLTQNIERMLGRTRKSINGQYSDRLIDIDILLYDKLHINTPELVVPHPLMQQRDFVMTPLLEIFPSFKSDSFL